MNQKDLTTTFMLVYKLKKPFGPHVFYQNLCAFQGLSVYLHGCNNIGPILAFYNPV